MQQEQPNLNCHPHKRCNRYNPNHRQQRPRLPIPITVPEGSVAFRIVCHVSIIGGLIGPSGSIIGQLRHDTTCLIHCKELMQGSDYRIVLIVGHGAPERRIKLKSLLDGDEEGEVYMVSSAQEAVIRVLERVWEVEAEKEGNEGLEGEGYCGLLADTTQIGAVVGRGGRTIKRIRKQSGAAIRILPPPHCAAKKDELIQITGASLAVKKALIALTGCLQGCLPVDEDQSSLSRPVEIPFNENSPDPHAELFPHLSSFLPPLTGKSVDNTSNNHLLSANVSKEQEQEMEGRQREVTFRLLCSSGAAGSIIGKKGSIVRTLQNLTGSSIFLAAPMTQSGERVVTISAFENPDSLCSAAQNAVIFVFARSVEHGFEKKLSSNSKGIITTARLLVPADQVGCWCSSNSKELTEIIEGTGADIRILEGDPVLDFASGNDVLLQISGEYKIVQHALFQVTGRLRDNVFTSDVLEEVKVKSPYGRERKPSSPGVKKEFGVILDSDQEASLTQGVYQINLSNNVDSPPPGLRCTQVIGLLTEKSVDNASNNHLLSSNYHKEQGPEMECRQQEVTFRLLCSNGAAGSIIGKNGSIVRTLQNQTGSSILFAAPITQSGERVVTISAFENPESLYSAAQNAVILVFAHSVEHGFENKLSSSLKGIITTARLLVPADQIGYWCSSNSKEITEIIEGTGADIRILEGDPVLDFASGNDVVLQISGEYKLVQNALFQVTGRLRDNVFASDVLEEVKVRSPHGRERNPSSPGVKKKLGIILDSDQEASLTQGVDQINLSNNVDSPPPGLRCTQVIGPLTRKSVDNASNNHVLSANGHKEQGPVTECRQRKVTFRLLCSNGAAGSIIGKNGSIVRTLQNQTGSSIFFAAAMTQSGERVVTISAFENPESLYSAAQNAVILVFARSVEHGFEKKLSSSLKGIITTARLLVPADQVGCWCSGNSKELTEIVEVTGADIQILEGDPVLYFASGNDVVLQISGEYKIVQNAMIQVTGRLRDDVFTSDVLEEVKVRSPYGRESKPSSPGVKKEFGVILDSNQEASLMQGIDQINLSNNADSPLAGLRCMPVIGPLTGKSVDDNASNNHLSSANVHKEQGPETECRQREVTFRLLCSNGAAGSIIGKNGSRVRTLQSQTGSSIFFAAAMTQSGERVVTISAFENPESLFSAAQNAVVLVFARSVEHGFEKKLSSSLKGISTTARLLVPADQVECWCSSNSKELTEMMEVTGAYIQMMEGDRFLDCASGNDVVLQISGEYKTVQSALFQVTGRLRDSVFTSEVVEEVTVRSPYGRDGKPSSPGAKKESGVTLDSDQEASWMLDVDRLNFSKNVDSHSPGLRCTQTVQRGCTAAITDNAISQTASGMGLELERSLDYLLPRDVLNEVGARNTHNFNRETISQKGNGPQSRLLLPHELRRAETKGASHSKRDLSTYESIQKSTYKGHLEIGSGKKYDIKTNNIIELVIPKPVFGSIYGEDGNNLARLRQISGAKVEVHDPHPGTGEGKVVISGTVDQTRIGQSLLHAFILGSQ